MNKDTLYKMTPDAANFCVWAAAGFFKEPLENVIPAQAGIHKWLSTLDPAFAGMTTMGLFRASLIHEWNIYSWMINSSMTNNLIIKKLRPVFLAFSSLAVFLSALHSGLAFAHAGEVDNHGGHFKQDDNSYHCHSEACFRQHLQSQQALEEAQQENRAFSKMYVRDDWPHWSDLDRDCQDTRAEILIATSKVKARHHRGKRCHKVLHGEWLDPYTNTIFYNAWEVDIDHRIALAEAHRYGGASWSPREKEIFANDPLNLIAVQADANKAKSSHPAYEWMPKNVGYWCEYIQVREQVVLKYALTFPEKEQEFNARIKREFCD